MMQYSAPTIADGHTIDEYKVWLYPIASEQSILRVYRENNTHLPKLEWGLGDNNNHGKGYVEKVENGLDIYYTTRLASGSPEDAGDGSFNGDTVSRPRGIAIRDSGIYQIRNQKTVSSGGVTTTKRALAIIPIFHVGQTVADCLANATNVGLNVEKGDIFITSTS